MIRVIFMLLAAFFVVGTAATVYVALDESGEALTGLISSFDAPVSDDPAPRSFYVEAGQSASEIGQELERQGIIRSALVFRLLVEFEGLDGKLGSGEFELRPNMTTAEIARVLADGGRMRTHTFTIPEGWRAEEIAHRLDQLGHARAGDVLAVVREPDRIAPYNHLLGSVPSLEGYLFPDTYEIAPSADGRAIVETMVRHFDRTIDAEMRERAGQVGLSLHQAVTLASIIEREAARAEERRLISGVFHNRLKTDMPLQADPTVQYAVANADVGLALAQGFWQELLPAQLRIESPYNTYVVKGLPPAPICNPGLSSLRAAVDPEQTDFYYFVARGDGSHVFARTQDEHVANIQQVEAEEQRARESGGA